MNGGAYSDTSSIGWPADDLALRAGARYLSAVYVAAQGAGATPDPMLLTLLTYCYGRGLYASSEIETATLEDSTARYICAHRYPDADTIRVFRRANKKQVERALGRLIERLGSGPCSDEAKKRVSQAIQLDSYLADI